jgi:hypothetical protein
MEFISMYFFFISLAVHVCFTVSGRDAIPKKGENGQFLYCNDDADCGKNFMCITTNYCCPIPKGKHSDLTVGEYGGK